LVALPPANVRVILTQPGSAGLAIVCPTPMRGPRARRGVTEHPGLYFLGLNWLHKPKSGLLYGVGEDAAYTVEHLTSKTRTSS